MQYWNELATKEQLFPTSPHECFSTTLWNTTCQSDLSPQTQNTLQQVFNAVCMCNLMLLSHLRKKMKMN